MTDDGAPAGDVRAIEFQLTIDAADPHAQARFWAAALGWTVEDHDAFVVEMLAKGIATDDDVIVVDGRHAWRTAEAVRAPAGAGSTTRRVLFQQVPEAKQVKNRVHMDLNVGHERVAHEVARLRGLGATELYQVDEPGTRHTTMADPEGNEFCVQ